MSLCPTILCSRLLMLSSLPLAKSGLAALGLGQQQGQRAHTNATHKWRSHRRSSTGPRLRCAAPDTPLALRSSRRFGQRHQQDPAAHPASGGDQRCACGRQRRQQAQEGPNQPLSKHPTAPFGIASPTPWWAAPASPSACWWCPKCCAISVTWRPATCRRSQSSPGRCAGARAPADRPHPGTAPARVAWSAHSRSGEDASPG